MSDRRLVTPYFLGEPSPPIEALAAPGDWINDASLPGGPQLARMSAVHERLAEAIRRTIAAGERPVSIAGDCCTVIGVFAGLQRAGIAPRLLWLDAHGDFNTPETSPSGFVGGMPLAMLAGRGDTTLLTDLGVRTLAEEDVILCDARDLDPLERIALEGSKVRHVRSIDEVLSLDLRDRPLHVHLDVDVLSLDEAPAMRYPAAGGVPVAQVEALARRFVPTSISMTTWSFEKDRDGRTRTACLRALGGLTRETPYK